MYSVYKPRQLEVGRATHLEAEVSDMAAFRRSWRYTVQDGIFDRDLALRGV